MKENNRLNRVFKEALQDHGEPLHEAQWLRLRLEMGAKKSKKRFLPWLILSLFVALSGLGAGYWLGYGKGQDQVAVGNQKEIASAKDSEKQDIDNKNGQAAGENETSAEHGTINKTPDTDDLADNDNSSGNENQGRNDGNAGRGDGTKSDGPGKRDGDVQRQDREGSGPDKDMKESRRGGNEKGPNKKIQEPVEEINRYKRDISKAEKEREINETEERDLSMAMKPLRKMKIGLGFPVPEMAQVIKTTNKPLKKDPKPDMGRARFAIGLSTGISPVNFKVKTIENNEKMRKDSRAVFEESNRNSRSSFVNLDFDWYVSKRVALSLNTGFQYRRIVKDVDQTYNFTEGILRDSIGKIVGYYPYDTFNPAPPPLQNVGRNSMTFISFPIRLGYVIPLSSRSELGISAGLNVSMITRARGNTLSINEITVKPLEESYEKKVNLGLNGGLQYNRNISGHWWLGLEAQWQQSGFNYDASFGVIRSRINITNYNLLIKYKF